MGILDNIERGLERAVNGAFAKTFKSGVQPVEIAAALKRELDVNAVIVDRDRVLAPNSFTVRMSPGDAERMGRMGPTLVDELIEVLQKHATRQQYQFPGGLEVSFAPDDSLAPGVVQVDSVTVRGRVSWQPVLDVGGRRHTLNGQRAVLGRGTEADVQLDDAGASRRHAEVVWDGAHAMVRDLGSTNGTTVNGRKVSQATLEPDAQIGIGSTTIVFRVIPRASGASHG